MRTREGLLNSAMATAALVCVLSASLAQAQSTGGSTTGGGGVMAPSRAHNPQSKTFGGQAVTAPSGDSPRLRSIHCNQVANQRHLTASARQEFRLSCLATAAPAPHAGTQHALPKPTRSKDALGVVTPPQPH